MLVILNSDNLVAEFAQLVEGGERGYAEDEKEALTGFHVEFAHGSCGETGKSLVEGAELEK